MKTTRMMACAIMMTMALIAFASESRGMVSESTQNAEDAVFQRVEQMKQVEYVNYNLILSSGLQQALNHANSVFDISDNTSWVGFEWAPGIMDVCGEKEPEIKVDKVKLIDVGHADVIMRYVDSPCYDFRYTLKLIWENGNWMIDDVYHTDYEGGYSNLRKKCDDLYKHIVNEYATCDAADVLAGMLSMEPLEANYTDPATIYYNNPKEIQHLIDQMHNGLELFKKNPGYTKAAGKRITDMINRVKRHL